MKTIISTLLILTCALSVNAQEIGKVIIAKKQVLVERHNQQIDVKRRSPLFKHDVVKTGEGAKAQFRLADGTVFSLGEQSELLIAEYLFSEEKSNAAFELTKGVFRAVTGAITNRDDPEFRVNTPVGSIGIRGTDFWGGYLDEDKVDVLLVSGDKAIIVTNQFGQVELTEPGQGTTIVPGKAPSPPKLWSDLKVQRAVATITMED